MLKNLLVVALRDVSGNKENTLSLRPFRVPNMLFLGSLRVMLEILMETESVNEKSLVTKPSTLHKF